MIFVDDDDHYYYVMHMQCSSITVVSCDMICTYCGRYAYVTTWFYDMVYLYREAYDMICTYQII